MDPVSIGPRQDGSTGEAGCGGEGEEMEVKGEQGLGEGALQGGWHAEEEKAGPHQLHPSLEGVEVGPLGGLQLGHEEEGELVDKVLLEEGLPEGEGQLGREELREEVWEAVRRHLGRKTPSR